MIGADIQSNNISQYQERITKFSSEFELGLFLHIARKSLIWIFLLLCISLSLAFLYLRYTQPVFQSKTIIQINNNNQATKVLNINQIYEEQDPLAASMEIIKSKVFLSRIINFLNLHISYFNEGTFKSSELYTSSPIVVDLNVKEQAFYKKIFYVFFIDSVSGYIEQKENKNKNKKIKFIINKWTKTEGFDFKINYNPGIQREECLKTIKELSPIFFIKQDENIITADIQQRLEIRLQNELAKTVSISIRDYNPNKAADIVNTIASEFQKYDIEKESKGSEKAILFINEQLSYVYAQLKNSEDSLELYRKEKNFNTNEHQIQADLTKISTLEDQLLKAEIEENILDNIQRDIQKNNNIDSYQLMASIAGTQEESGIKDVLFGLQKLLLEKENLLFQVKPASEEIKRLNFQIEIQKKILIEAILSVRKKTQLRYQNLKSRSDEFENKYSSQPEKEIEYARLFRSFNISEKYYTLLLEKKTEFAISKAGSVSQTIILEKGIPNFTPTSPNKIYIALVSVLSCLLIGLTFIVIRYLTHNEINSLNEIIKQMSASINVLGIVPNYDKEIPVSQLVVDKNPKSLIAEAFRTIRSNLQYISNKEGTKIIALTSTVSGEGKTFVAINLAGIIAFSNKKVIILDLDMRKPKIHKGFGVNNEKGMSTILIESNSIDQCIKKSSLPDLDFITAGPIPPNPSELIISNKMDEILNELKKTYDYIVIDNPPIGLVTDGIAMISKADFPIYVFRSDYSKRNYIQILDRLQNEKKVAHLSIVLNGVDINRNTYGYNYGYGYGYGYGNKYGYYEEKGDKDKKYGFFKKINVS